LLIFINGYVSLSLELIAIRQVGIFAGNTAVTTSIIIGIFLAFMSFGYYHGAVLRLIKTNLRKLLYISFVIIALMIMFGGSHTLIEDYFTIMADMGIKSNIAGTFIYSLMFLSAAPYLFGLNTALMSRFLHRYNRDYTGKIMAIDTIGSVLGSLLTTLILMPMIGVNHTVIIVVFLALCGAYIAKPRKKSLISFVIILAMTYAVNSDYYLYEQHRIVENNAVSTISIHDGDDGNSKLMVMNWSNASKFSKDKNLYLPYIKYIEDNIITKMPKDEQMDVLVLGAGGFTIGYDDHFHNYTFIDIDKSLLEVSEKYFLEEKLTMNKEFIVEDASQFLKYTPKMYDLIFLDTYSSQENIPQDLVTEEYLQRVKDKLKPGGIVVMNIISSPSFNNRFTMKFDNTVRKIFGHNIQRQVIGEFDAWNGEGNNNIVYIIYNKPNSGATYTHDKNTLIFDM
jgi:predicted membrane-bound spermidine synthase